MATMRTATSAQRPGLRAYEESVGLQFPELVTRLRETLGARLVAFIGNVSSTRQVSTWADGKSSPGQLDEQRLRVAYQIAGTLRERYSAATTQSWFQGMNPALDYTAPASVLRDEDPATAGKQLLSAAASFAYVG